MFRKTKFKQELNMEESCKAGSDTKIVHTSEVCSENLNRTEQLRERGKNG